MGIGFMMLLPFVFWIFIVMLIIAVSSSGKSRRSAQQGQRPTAQRYPSARKNTGRVASVRPQMEKGLFDMKLGREKQGKEKSFSLSDMLNKTGFDRYEAKGRKKDFVDGYDRTINVKKAQHMQYSHTYDGHEPWDDCLPKEKDPWDKDFYV